MQKLLLLPLLLLSVYYHHVSGEQVILSNATACVTAEGCYFEDPRIWSTGVVPTAADYVQIVRPTNTSEFKITIQSHVQVVEIDVTDIDLVVAYNASLHANQTKLASTNLTIVGNVTTNGFFSYGSMIAVDGTLNLGAGMVWLSADSVLTIVGNFTSLANQAQATFAGKIEALNTASHVMFTYLYLQRTDTFFLCLPVINVLSIEPLLNVTFIEGLFATEITIPAATTLNVYGFIYVDDSVSFESSTSVLNVINAGQANTYAGLLPSVITWFYPNNTGALNIHSSNIILTGDNFEILTNVSVYEGSTISLQGLVFNHPGTLVFVESAGNTTAYTKVIADGITLRIPVTIIGDLQVISDSDIYQNINVTGSVTIDAENLAVYNSVLTTTSLIVGYVNGSGLNLWNSTLIVPLLWIAEHGTLSATSVGYIHGNVINNGTLNANDAGRFVISGNYLQPPNGRLGVVLYVTRDNTPAIQVNGSVVTENGKISVTSASLTSQTYTVLHATEYINGTFAAPVLFGGSGDQSLHLEYNPNSVVVVYNHSSSSDDGFWHTPWPWVIFGVLGGVILITVVVVLVRRRRGQYETIRA